MTTEWQNLLWWLWWPSHHHCQHCTVISQMKGLHCTRPPPPNNALCKQPAPLVAHYLWIWACRKLYWSLIVSSDSAMVNLKGACPACGPCHVIVRKRGKKEKKISCRLHNNCGGNTICLLIRSTCINWLCFLLFSYHQLLFMISLGTLWPFLCDNICLSLE